MIKYLVNHPLGPLLLFFTGFAIGTNLMAYMAGVA